MAVSIFRGASGEVVKGFVHPRTFCTLLPVGFAFAVCALPVVALTTALALPATAAVALLLIAAGPVVGRFALAARGGRLGAGFVAARPTSAALLGFTARYAVVVGLGSVAWWLASGFAGRLALTSALGDMAPTWLTRAVPALAVATWGLVATTLAARAESVGEILGPVSWRWLLGKRRGDLSVLVTTFVGASVTFTALVWPAAIVLEPIVANLVRDLGFTPVAGLAWGLPLIGLLVLAGRLGGAFGAEEMGTRDADDAPDRRMLAIGPLPLSALGALTGTATAPAGTQARPPAQRAAASPTDRLGNVPDGELGQAILEGEQLLRMEPHKPNVAAELARLYQRAAHPEEAARVASIAIERALAASMPTVAAQVFHRFEPEERTEFCMPPPVLEQLGWLLLQRKELEGTLWCFETFGRAGGAPRQLEKGLVAVADAHVLAGDDLHASALYRNFLRRFPESHSAEYVRAALMRLDVSARHEQPAPSST